MNFSMAVRHLFVRLCSLRTCESRYRLQASASIEGFITALFFADVLTQEQYAALDDLANSAFIHSGQPYPSASNAGPVMTHGVAYERSRAKSPAQVKAHEQPQLLPAPSTSPGLRLLCLLVPSRTGRRRSLPVHVLRPMPPRADIQGRWAMGLPAGLVLRETQARPPRPEVLVRCLRQRAAHAFRASTRAVRGLSHGY